MIPLEICINDTRVLVILSNNLFLPVLEEMIVPVDEVTDLNKSYNFKMMFNTELHGVKIAPIRNTHPPDQGMIVSV